jgi:hypothetical protein
VPWADHGLHTCEAKVILGFKDPRDIVKGKIDSKINGAESDAVNAARGAVIKTGKAAGDAAKKVAGKDQPNPEKEKKNKKMGWWPFGGKTDDAAAPACPSCNKEVDPTWQACPYCRAPLGQAAAGQAAPPPPVPNRPGTMAPGGGPPNMPVIQGDKTMAIDISQLAGPKRGVVGWLVCMNGNQKGMDFRIFDGVNTIGAGADCDIVVTDEYLSSKHALIRYEEGKYEFKDNDSTNGSFLNEKKTTKDELIDNDTIRLGRTELRFKALY